MGTIKICDWTKKRIGANEKTFIISLGDGRDETSHPKVFEVSELGYSQLLACLESENITSYGGLPIEPAPTQRRQAPVVQESNVDEPEPLDTPIDEGVKAGDPTPIKIPESTKEKLPMPTTAQAERVIAESTRFPSGGLASLTPGKVRNSAAKKLAEKEALFESTFKSQKERLS